jgi:glyoxylase-like metal-dependent hydrolase (beta-lactamase superfamily II)
VSAQVRYVFDGEPAPGETREVAPGVRWLRMPLPFELDHINLWLLEDGPGWTIVDTGINRDGVKEAWERIFASDLGGRPVSRLIVTHFHPDHMGLAGWLTERWDVDIWVTLGEWAFARMLSLDSSESFRAGARRFYHAAGFDDGLMSMLDRLQNQYQQRAGHIPARFRRLREGDVVTIGERHWRIIVGAGHSPEHACLYCDASNLLIAGDQILPRISPNVSVWHSEPEADPLRLYLDSLEKFRHLPGDTLVLPSHDWPFTGLHGRLDDLAHHHDDRLDETLVACARPSTGMDVARHLFNRQLDSNQVVFALGESLAHLHWLMGRGRIQRQPRADGVHLFRRSLSEEPAAAAS